MPQITVIPATVNLHTHLPKYEKRKRRVAAYARVSTEQDEQTSSYEAQVDYYTKHIKENAEWEFVNVYTDEGISGTNTKKRKGFNDMVEDALAGKIDLILTKSVSRFARNTVDSLVTIRKLKEAGCEVFFEKENIYTFDGKGEVMLTIMSSFAQEESRSISENVTWGKRKSAADGKVYVGYSHFLGYDKGPEKGGPMQVNPDQAEIVKRIYRDFMGGKTPFTIASELTAEGVATPAGKKKWRTTTVENILSNEKYKGCAILQKTYTVDFLSKTIKKNEGEVPQYYVEDSHEAIIQPDEWEEVQIEIARRKALGRHYSGNSLFASRLICGDCGGYFGPKVWNSNNPLYRRTIWQCNDKFKGEKKCGTPHLTEEAVKEKFVAAFNEIFDIKDELLANLYEIRDRYANVAAIEEEQSAVLGEIDVVTELTRRAVEENARKEQDQTAFNLKYAGFERRFEELKRRYEELAEKKESLLVKGRIIDSFISALKRRERPLDEFDERLWQITVDTAEVRRNGAIVFTFADGTKIEK
jgi:DNA invertase Pin-like site-specific DNA recombinase